MFALGAVDADTFTTGDAKMREGLPVVRTAILHAGLVRDEAAEEARVAALCDGERRVKLCEVVDGVQLIARLAQKGGARGTPCHRLWKVLDTVLPTRAAVHQRNRLGAAVVQHQVHNVLDEKVVLEERHVSLGDVRLGAALGAVYVAPLRCETRLLSQLLQTEAAVGVRAGKDAGVFVEEGAAGALQLRAHAAQDRLGVELFRRRDELGALEVGGAALGAGRRQRSKVICVCTVTHVLLHTTSRNYTSVSQPMELSW